MLEAESKAAQERATELESQVGTWKEKCRKSESRITKLEERTAELEEQLAAEESKARNAQNRLTVRHLRLRPAGVSDNAPATSPLYGRRLACLQYLTRVCTFGPP